MTHFHNNACSILPVGQRGQSLRGGASPAPVVAENFLYAGAQNPSASPVKEVAPPVRGGGVCCRTIVPINMFLKGIKNSVKIGEKKGPSIFCQI